MNCGIVGLIIYFVKFMLGCLCFGNKEDFVKIDTVYKKIINLF